MVSATGKFQDLGKASGSMDGFKTQGSLQSPWMGVGFRDDFSVKAGVRVYSRKGFRAHGWLQDPGKVLVSLADGCRAQGLFHRQEWFQGPRKISWYRGGSTVLGWFQDPGRISGSKKGLRIQGKFQDPGTVLVSRDRSVSG
jgi:hypothetical protein